MTPRQRRGHAAGRRRAERHERDAQHNVEARRRRRRDGPLAGDPLVRSLQRQLRGYTTTSLTGFQDDPIHLADFGVKTARDGTISLDQEVFRRTFEANPDSFAAITNSRITSSSGLVSAAILGTQPADGVYTFDLADDGSATINGDAMTRDGVIIASRPATRPD